VVAVLCGTVVLLWPAVWNGFPLLFADSYEYLYTGWGVWRRLLGEPVAEGAYLSNRSEMYAAGIYLLERLPSWGSLLWPVVAVQAALTAWVLWLAVRSVRGRRTVPVYLAVVVLLGMLTGVAWFASDIMPDILGPLLYLCVYLLVFTREELDGWEVAGLAAIAWWATGSHTSHLLVAAGLCGLLGVLWLARWRPMRGRGGGLLGVAGLVLLTMATQMAMHKRLYGRASLAGAAPPFLMARLLGDGPARTYLQQHCATLDWTICAHVKELPSVDWQLMWTEHSIWKTATPEQRLQLQREQVPLAVATLRAYPLQQMGRTGSNVVQLLTTTGPWDFLAYPVFTPEAVKFMAPGSAAAYARSRQAHQGMPQELFRAVQAWTVAAAALVAAWLLWRTWRRSEARLLGLACVLLSAVAANAFVGGAFSGPYARYQVRVLWLVPLLAGLLAVAERREAQRE